MFRILIGSVFVWIAGAFAGTPAFAISTLSDGEMDGISAGLLDATAKITVAADAKSTCVDGSQCWSNSTGGGTGVASIPTYNGLTVKNDSLASDEPKDQPGGTVPGGGVGREGGSVAAAHNLSTAARVDSSNQSTNTGLMNIKSTGGDVAAASGAGAMATQSDPFRGNDDDDVTGAGSDTFVIGFSVIQGHGNKDDSLKANAESDASKEDKLKLNQEVQESSKTIALTNTLVEVGDGVNTAAVTNKNEGALMFNFNRGINTSDQMVANFSTGTPSTTNTVTLTPVTTTVQFGSVSSDKVNFNNFTSTGDFRG